MAAGEDSFDHIKKEYFHSPISIDTLWNSNSSIANPILRPLGKSIHSQSISVPFLKWEGEELLLELGLAPLVAFVISCIDRAKGQKAARCAFNAQKTLEGVPINTLAHAKSHEKVYPKYSSMKNVYKQACKIGCMPPNFSRFSIVIRYFTISTPTRCFLKASIESSIQELLPSWRFRNEGVQVVVEAAEASIEVDKAAEVTAIMVLEAVVGAAVAKHLPGRKRISQQLPRKPPLAATKKKIEESIAIIGRVEVEVEASPETILEN
eukprot:scaffold3348_cov74-Cylindrotheca_fusiformis.AAC.7